MKATPTFETELTMDSDFRKKFVKGKGALPDVETFTLVKNGSTDTTPSSYSFNQTAGISILKYAGSGSTPTKIAHGLGVAPKLIIVKNLSGTADWVLGHGDMAWTKYIYLSSNAASFLISALSKS